MDRRDEKQAWGAFVVATIWLFVPGVLLAEEAPPAAQLSVKQLFLDGGTIGYIIVALSLALVAMVFEHLATIRRGTMIPRGLADDVHKLLSQGQYAAAQEACRARPSFLGYILSAGISEVSLGYASVEKAMEDSATEQAARLVRKIDYLSLIGAIAPMLGLMGTVWGMILAFMEFEKKANPPISDLAPGIYKALVTTLFGLIVAIPATAAFAYFRNRVDELVAQAALTAEHVFRDWKKQIVERRRQEKQSASGRGSSAGETME